MKVKDIKTGEVIDVLPLGSVMANGRVPCRHFRAGFNDREVTVVVEGEPNEHDTHVVHVEKPEAPDSDREKDAKE
jgi:hypothetical protein